MPNDRAGDPQTEIDRLRTENMKLTVERNTAMTLGQSWMNRTTELVENVREIAKEIGEAYGTTYLTGSLVEACDRAEGARPDGQA